MLHTVSMLIAVWTLTMLMLGETDDGCGMLTLNKIKICDKLMFYTYYIYVFFKIRNIRQIRHVFHIFLSY